MIIGKEALVNLERMANSQYRVYPDSADIGIELTHNELEGIRADVKTLKGIYNGTNYIPAPDYAGVKNIIIPIEEVGANVPTSTGVYRCIKLDVLVSKQFRTIAYIDIKSDTLGAEEIPFFSK